MRFVERGVICLMSFTWDELDLIEDKDQWRHPLPPTCPRCGYNLTGLPRNRCPECGTHFDWKEVRRRAAYTWVLVCRVRYANQDARTGLIISLIGWAAVGIFRLPGLRPVAPVVDFIAALAAILALILTSQILNLWRVPAWARAYISDPPPDLMLGAAAFFVGLTLLVGAFLLP